MTSHWDFPLLVYLTSHGFQYKLYGDHGLCAAAINCLNGSVGRLTMADAPPPYDSIVPGSLIAGGPLGTGVVVSTIAAHAALVPHWELVS